MAGSQATTALDATCAAIHFAASLRVAAEAPSAPADTDPDCALWAEAAAGDDAEAAGDDDDMAA
jgi:hypothetical protein